VLQPGFRPWLMFSDEELEAIVLALRLTAKPGNASHEHAARDVIHEGPRGAAARAQDCGRRERPSRGTTRVIRPSGSDAVSVPAA
jgi:predicted DNA-binding transcriptional regulator YafY